MAFWNADLTTEDGALGATQNGGLACMIAALLGVLSIVLVFVTGLVLTVAGMAIVVGEIAVFAVAAFRLRSGKGLFWGSAAAVLLMLELVLKLLIMARFTTVMGVAGVMIDVVLLIVLINGLRGAAALRRGLNLDGAAEIFS